MERIMCSVSKTHGIIEPDISRINWKHPPDLGRRLVAKRDGVTASAVHQSGSTRRPPRLAGCASALPQLACPWPSDPDAAFCPDATERERASA
jgi:hypothetical protein